MSLVLRRIDDRLIHGQVIVGWGRALGIGLIVLVDDDVAASEWEQELYRMAVPADIDLVFATVAAAAEQLTTWDRDPRRGILLTGDIGTMAALHAADRRVVHSVNLGGIHHRPGRIERLPYVYLTDDELRELRTLERAGAAITAQDVPTSRAVELDDLR